MPQNKSSSYHFMQGKKTISLNLSHRQSYTACSSCLARASFKGMSLAQGLCCSLPTGKRNPPLYSPTFLRLYCRGAMTALLSHRPMALLSLSLLCLKHPPVDDTMLLEPQKNISISPVLVWETSVVGRETFYHSRSDSAIEDNVANGRRNNSV